MLFLKSFLNARSTLFVGKEIFKRNFADKIIKTPHMAESITSGTLASWEKKVGDYVKQDEVVANIETDKVGIPVNSPSPGTIVALFAKEGDTIQVGTDLFKLSIDENGTGPASSRAEREQKREIKTEIPQPSKGTNPTVPSGELPASISPKEEATNERKKDSESDKSSSGTRSENASSREETRVAMTRMRLRIAERMKESQTKTAALTTFNEVDMSSVMELRNKYKEAILKRHNIKLGFMSLFVKASSIALTEFPLINARIEDNEIVYSNFVDISVAVATPKGLVTPVLRDCHQMSMLKIERAIGEFGEKAKAGKIALEDLAGGTFTISNGGVFGSLMGTPIINTPQSAILGMHSIKDRAVVVEGKIEVRPIMNLALTYDHRLIDGREAVMFLVRIKELVEDPRRMLLDI